MKRKRFTEEQIIGVLKEHDLGVKTSDLCRKHGISEANFYNWKSKHCGIDVSDARRANREPCRQRNPVECFFKKLRQFRRVVTRYDKTARNFLAASLPAATRLWLRFESTT